MWCPEIHLQNVVKEPWIFHNSAPSMDDRAFVAILIQNKAAELTKIAEEYAIKQKKIEFHRICKMRITI